MTMAAVAEPSEIAKEDPDIGADGPQAFRADFGHAFRPEIDRFAFARLNRRSTGT